MTDSGSDSECFESADEGLEDDAVEQNFSEVKNSSNHKTLVDTPSSAPPTEDQSKNSTQYRKRPERGKTVKNPTAVSSASNVTKTPLKDQIFKADIIKPDVLIQDITTNLSKNLNKGFSTITQTSSSIKDLVINSLPLTTQKESSKFSYDDEDEKVSDISESDDDSDKETNVGSEDKLHDIENFENDSSLPTTHNLKLTCVEEDKTYSDIISGIDAIQVSDSTSQKQDNNEVKETVRDSNDALNIEDQTNTTNIVEEECPEKIEIKEETDNKRSAIINDDIDISKIETKEPDISINKCENTKDLFEKQNDNEILVPEQTEIESDVEKSSNDCFEDEKIVKSEVINQDEADVLNEKDGWDSSEIDLDELDIEESNTVNNLEKNIKFEKNSENIKEDNKENIGDTQLSDDNEGWDDFDIEDEELIGVSAKAPVEKQSSPESHLKSSNIENKPANNEYYNKNETRWMGWENFGERPEQKQKSGWTLGGWGVNAILNTATSVTQGLSNVLEAGLGAPDPETLARIEKESKKDVDIMRGNKVVSQEKEYEEGNSNSGLNLFPSFGLTNLVAGVTKNIVENTKVHEIGSKVISGGLGTLESFGKKTMEVLQEGDPGLKKKRALLLGTDKPSLSQVLREAKSKAELEDKKMEEKQMAKMCHFETLFDDFQGLIHLEALEMLSRQCELKIEQIKASLSTQEVEDLIGILDEVKELCIIDEDEFKANYSTVVDFKMSLESAVEPLKNEISVQKIIQVYDELESWWKSENISSQSPQSVCQKAMSTLAKITAATVQQFHKGGELLSIKEHRKTVEEADSLLQLTGFLCCEINHISEKFLKLHTSRQSDNDVRIAQKIKEESVNATSYIKDAFNLLIPVLQLGAAT